MLRGPVGIVGGAAELDSGYDGLERESLVVPSPPPGEQPGGHNPTAHEIRTGFSKNAIYSYLIAYNRLYCTIYHPP